MSGFFFDNPIPAKDPRNFGFLLLDKAMENHAGLSFDSYDRLFPNQDIMPDGGFGNLIALPLQYVPRKSDNSEFVDNKFNACPKTLTIVLANKIYIPTDVLPQALLARLKRTASFSNPVFFKTQALRFSTHGIPRFICLAHIEQGYLSLPRGCLDDVLVILEQQLILAEFDDKRKMGQTSS